MNLQNSETLDWRLCGLKEENTWPMKPQYRETSYWKACAHNEEISWPMKPQNRDIRLEAQPETTEQRDIILEAMRTQLRDHLANETAEHRESRLQHRRQREQQQLQEKLSLLQLLNQPSIQTKMKKFHSYFSSLQSPTYTAFLAFKFDLHQQNVLSINRMCLLLSRQWYIHLVITLFQDQSLLIYRYEFCSHKMNCYSIVIHLKPPVTVIKLQLLYK